MHINQQMTDFVINLLKSGIPETYYYHNYEHSLYVMQQAIEIGKHEQCTDKELQLLNTAALWHDIGYINIYFGHEEESCRLVRQYLPGYGYTDEEIEKICGMIMATKVPQLPQNKLEEILADADLEYLGTGHAAILANDLFKELSTVNPALTKEAWDKTEIDFLTEHHYFTRYCIENKQLNKQSYLNGLIGNKA